MNDYFGSEIVNKALAQPVLGLPAEWSSLLREFVAHDSEARAYVESKAADSTDVRGRALANALLTQWDLSVHSDRLKYPLAIHTPKLKPDQKRRLEIFSIGVEVGEDGRVLSARFTTPPDQLQLGREVLGIVRTWLFRPAFRDGRFVGATVDQSYTVHVK